MLSWLWIIMTILMIVFDKFDDYHMLDKTMSIHIMEQSVLEVIYKVWVNFKQEANPIKLAPVSCQIVFVLVIDELILIS